MRRFLAVAILLCTASLTATIGRAAPLSEMEAVRTVLTANPVPADIFAESFLAQVPISKLIPIREQVTAPLGVFQRIEGASGQYKAYYTQGWVTVFIHLDAQGKIDTLVLRNPIVTGGNLDEAVKGFETLPGVASYA